MYINPQMMDIIKDCKLIDSGFQGTCYHDDKYVYKLYSNPMQYMDRLDTLGYPSDLIAFPIETYTEGNKIIGYKMKYFPGTRFEAGMDESAKLDDIKKAYSEIKSEVKNFEQFEMGDLCYANVLFDNKRFYIIDTDRWELNYKYIYNITMLNESINYGLVNSLSREYYSQLIGNLRYPVDGMIDEMIWMYHAIYGENPETIGDFKKKI